MEKVSVIIPNYNMGRFLPRALSSVSSQKYPNIEVIIADDGSEDNSQLVIEELCRLSKDGLSIFQLRRSHAGKASTLNSALEHVSGDFVTFLDADDTLPDGSLDSRVEFLHKNLQVEGVFTDANQVGADGKIYHVRRPPQNISNEELARMLLSSVRSPLFANTFMLKKEALEKSGKFDASYLRTEDHDFVFRVLTRCNVAYLPVATYNYHTSTHGYGERLYNRVISGSTRFLFISTYTHGFERLKYTAKAAFVDFAKLVYEVFDVIYAKRCLGKNGKQINVLKFRTMIPDADENLDRVLEKGLDEFGKPMKDDRITGFGALLRRYWLDELPQLYNVLKGDISIVGIRPRREVDWKQFTEQHKRHALRYKPGLLGVPYANLKSRSFETMIETESQYLAERNLHPYITQLKYFFLISFNILFKGARGR